MAIPKKLKPIDKDKALKTIARYTKSGCGQWEYEPGVSDFVYRTNTGRYMLIRPGWNDTYETGPVSM